VKRRRRRTDFLSLAFKNGLNLALNKEAKTYGRFATYAEMHGINVAPTINSTFSFFLSKGGRRQNPKKTGSVKLPETSMSKTKLIRKHNQMGCTFPKLQSQILV
jgi:hypothetical protein